MTYKLNTALLSRIFERSFALTNFDWDYCKLVEQLNSSQEICCFRGSPNIKSYRTIYRKLCHFFDDFNYFISISLSPEITQSRYSKFGNVADGLKAFILRVGKMNIPSHMKDSIESFLTAQINSHQLTQSPLQRLVRSSKIKVDEVPKHCPLENNLRILNVGVPSEKLRQADMILLLSQLAHTWKKFPELRLGQLISNSLPQGISIFYATDAKLLKYLQNFEVQHG